MITGHVWRPAPSTTSGPCGATRGRGPALLRPCEFMNCRRPRAEHERSVSLRHTPWVMS